MNGDADEMEQIDGLDVLDFGDIEYEDVVRPRPTSIGETVEQAEDANLALSLIHI